MSITDQVARAICAESCAYMGEPPCYNVRDDQDKPMPWPNPNCDEPGCQALALAAVAAMDNISTTVANGALSTFEHEWKDNIGYELFFPLKTYLEGEIKASVFRALHDKN